MRHRPPATRAVAIALVAAVAAGRAAADEPAPSPFDELLHPAIERNGERLVEVSGSFDVGLRKVTGDDGRYDQDVNLDDGLVLRSARVRGDGLVDGLLVRTFSADLVGVGDPWTTFDLRATLPEAYDLRIWADRSESVFLGAYDPNPLDAVRGRFGGRLDFRPGRDLEVHLSTERRTREGEGTLDHIYRQDRVLPVASTARYDGRFHSVGFDATPGIFRFGATGTFGSAVDESVRTLDRPDTPIDDRGNYAIAADVESVDLTGRAGVRLLGAPGIGARPAVDVGLVDDPAQPARAPDHGVARGAELPGDLRRAETFRLQRLQAPVARRRPARLHRRPHPRVRRPARL